MVRTVSATQGFCGESRIFACVAVLGLGLSSPAAAQDVVVANADTPAAELDALLADAIQAGDFAVVKAGVEGGKLVVTGTTKAKRKKVTLDGEFTTKSNKKSVFEFDLVYLPEDCIVDLASQGETLNAVVQDCGPKGDAGEKGAKGAKGNKGTKGDPGAQGDPGAKGDPGDKGDKGDPGEKGDTGDTGAQGPTGIVETLTFNGAASSVVLTDFVSNFIGPTATVTGASGQRVSASVTAILGSSTDGGELFKFGLCSQSQPGGTVLFFPGSSHAATIESGQKPFTASNSRTLPFDGEFKIGFCATNDLSSDGVSLDVVDTVIGWGIFTND